MQDGLYHTSATVQTLRDRPVDFTARKQGKPGYNPQAERAFLGAVYLQPPDYQEMADLWMGKVHKADLDEPKHGALYDAFRGIRAAGKVPDMVTVNAWLSEHGELKLWREWESEITIACQGATKIAEYARIVFENAAEREKRSIATRMLQGSLRPDEAMYSLEVLIDRQQAFDLPSLTGADAAALLPGRMASDIDPQPLQWIWPGRLARGKLTALSGDAGLGKGLLGIQIAARLTRGQALPGMLGRFEPTNVVMLTPEDEPADTIVPRLIAAGADTSRVRILDFWRDEQGEKHQFTLPRDVARIEEVIRHDHAGVFLIDPIMGCLDAGVKTGIDSEVRAALMPLKDMAERIGCAVPYVLHLNKDGRSNNALFRSGGSVAFLAVARFAFLIAKHPSDEQLRVMAPVKQNIGAGVESLMFSIHQMEGRDETFAYMRWSHEECDLRANDLLGGNANTSVKRHDILSAVKAHGTAGITQIAAFLDIATDDAKAMAALRKLLQRMVEAGELQKEARGLYMLPNTQSQPSQMS